MPNDGLSCLICTHRAPPSLNALLDSLRNQSWRKGDEIILVDNGIDTARRAEIEQALEPWHGGVVRVAFEKEERVGKVAARLKSLALATNDWLITLDDDNLLAPDVVSRIRQLTTQHPDLGGICPRIVPRWEHEPAKWIVALGHQILSYNASDLFQSAPEISLWPPGKKGMQPPGGGMIVHRRATDAFVRLANAMPYLGNNLGRGGTRLNTGEDFIIYGFLYRMGLSTAYDSSILIYHQIPAVRMRLSYLLRLLYYTNLSFGQMGILRFGKANVLYAGLRGTARLIYEMSKLALTVPSWRIPVAFAAALGGLWVGTWSGFFDRQCACPPGESLD